MVKMSVDVSDDPVPKKKKKHNIESAYDSTSCSNKELNEGIVHLNDKGSCITLKKVKRKKHSCDSDSPENGVKLGEKYDNTGESVLDEISYEKRHKNKKSKSINENSEEAGHEDSKLRSPAVRTREVTVESELIDENNLIATENERSSHKKKSKKRKSLEEEIEKREEVAPGIGEALPSQEEFTISYPVKEKRKSKVSKTSLIPEVMDGCMEGSLDIDNTDQLHIEEPVPKKKKKKKSGDKSYEENEFVNIKEENSDSATAPQIDSESISSSKFKKKRRSLDSLDSAGKTNGIDCQENEVKHKSKKKKRSIDTDASVQVVSKVDSEENEKKEHDVDGRVEERSDGKRSKKNKKKKELENLKKSIEQDKSETVQAPQTFGFNFFDAGERLNELKVEGNSEEEHNVNKEKEKRDVQCVDNEKRLSPKKNKRKSVSFKQEIPETQEIIPKMEPMRLDLDQEKERIGMDLELPETEQESTELKQDTIENTDEQDPVEEDDGGRSRTVGGFTIIDRVKQIRKTKVDRVLPEWLSNPTTVSLNLGEGIPVKDIGRLDPFLSKCLEREKIDKFFPIQAAVIPELLSSSSPISMRFRPRDICVSAPTGSGKTLAYVLPIIQALRKRVVPRLRALILLPTQELALQVHNVIEKFARFCHLKLCLAIGSHSFKKEQQTLIFQDSSGMCAADILIATPGRLADHITSTEGLTFRHLRFFVIDEADLFLSASGGDMMLKIEQLKKHIHRPLPDNSLICGGFCVKDSIRLPEPYMQQVLISATLLHDPEQLKILDLYRPKLFIARREEGATEGTVVPYVRPEELREEYVIVDSSLKPLVLYHLIHTHKLRRVLVFTKSTTATKTLSIFLSAMSKNCKIASISAKEGNRKMIMKEFSKGKIDVLISSDVMARGLDLTRINQVVSYDVPSLQNYVHRIGRTGRAGRQGFALSLVEDTPDVRKDFKAILNSCEGRLHKIEVTEGELRRYDQQYQAALATLKETVSKEKKTVRSHKLKAKLERIKKPRKKNANTVGD